jgi:hypothetical protein
MDAEHVQRLVVENTPRLQFGNGVGDVLAHGVGAMLLVIRHTRMALLHFEAMAEVSPRSQTDLAIRILHEVLFRRSRRHVHDPALVGRLVDGLLSGFLAEDGHFVALLQQRVLRVPCLLVQPRRDANEKRVRSGNPVIALKKPRLLYFAVLCDVNVKLEHTRPLISLKLERRSLLSGEDATMVGVLVSDALERVQELPDWTALVDYHRLGLRLVLLLVRFVFVLRFSLRRTFLWPLHARRPEDPLIPDALDAVLQFSPSFLLPLLRSLLFLAFLLLLLLLLFSLLLLHERWAQAIAPQPREAALVAANVRALAAAVLEGGVHPAAREGPDEVTLRLLRQREGELL